MTGSLLDRMTAEGAIRGVFQPIVDLRRPRPALAAIEGLARGRASSNLESPDLLFEYARRKHEEVRFDRAAIASILAAAAEIRRAADDERFVHVLLVGGSERPYGEPRYLPIFEAAAECGLPVAIHSGGEGLGLAAPPGGAGAPTFYIEWHTLGSAGSIMAHLVSLLVNGVFERLPSLKVMLLEGGLAWLPGILWRLDTNWRALREDTPWLDRKPSEVAREHVRFTTQPLEHTDGHDELLFELLAAAGAPDILCFASDYPHCDFDDPAFMLRRLPERWREPVMHGNAAALYGERLGLVPA